MEYVLKFKINYRNGHKCFRSSSVQSELIDELIEISVLSELNRSPYDIR